MESINGNLAIRVAIDTADIQWSPSPSGTVWRKRVHLVGPPESGQVTSVVRYDAGATFPLHNHPGGEEILVLDGVFSDEHGDWPKGTYLLNPEGFRHAPFSRNGCMLLVKLKQFPGLEREHVAIQTDEIDWQASSIPAIDVKPLYRQRGFSDWMRLERWEAATTPGKRVYEHGAEIFVLDGQFEDESGVYGSGHWLRFPIGAEHTAGSPEGCTLFTKHGGLAYLQSEA